MPVWPIGYAEFLPSPPLQISGGRIGGRCTIFVRLGYAEHSQDSAWSEEISCEGVAANSGKFTSPVQEKKVTIIF